jgi:glycosyltransferase involved in cell wall biosynthesis
LTHTAGPCGRGARNRGLDKPGADQVSTVKQSVPVVVTLHDLYPYDLPDNFGFPNYCFYFTRMILCQCLNSVDGIACVFNSTKQLLQDIFPTATGRAAAEVTSNYVKISKDGLSYSEIAERFGGASFLPSVTQHRKNKNLDILIRAYARLLKSPAERSWLFL